MRTRVRSAVVLVLAIGVLAGCESTWSSPDGGPDRSRANVTDKTITPANVSALHRVWHVEGLTGPPAVGTGVYAVTGTELVKLNRATGSELWRTDLGAPLAGGPVLETTGDGERVRVGSGPSSTTGFREREFNERGTETLNPIGDGLPVSAPLATRRDGHSVHVYPGTRFSAAYIDVSGKPMAGLTTTTGDTSPTLGKRYLYQRYMDTSLSGGLAAYDPDQPCPDDLCQPVWKTGASPGGPAQLGPDGTVYMAGRDDNPYVTATAIDGTTGARKWEASAFGMHPAELAIAGESVFAAGHVIWPGTGPGTGLAALRAGDGSVRWRSSGLDLASGVAVAGDLVFVTGLTDSTGSDWVVQAYAAAGCGADECAPLWTSSVEGRVSSPVVGSGRLYVSTDSGLSGYALS
jgi:outer membrane protein assembly factor BamB